MEEQENKTIQTFDSFFTNSGIQMLKILFSHLPPARQGAFAVYIKFMELQHTLSLTRHKHPYFYPSNGTPISSDFFSGDNEGTLALLDELLPFSREAERERILQMKRMMQSMKQMKEMMDMIQMMRELFPEGGEGTPMDFFSNMGSGASSPMDFFSAMGNPSSKDGSGMPDFSNIADLFSMFSNNTTADN